MADGTHSATDGTTGVVWEWWMLVLIGYAATAATVSLILAVLCLVWRCRQLRGVRAPAACHDEADTARHAVNRSCPVPSALSRIASVGACAVVEAAASPCVSHTALNHSFGFTACLERAGVDGGDSHASPTEKRSWLSCGDAEEAIGDGAAFGAVSADRRSALPEDIFVAVTSCEGPTKRMQRNRSIAAHMDVGLSQEESLRLHLMRHADTSDPFFGDFVKSSRGKR